MTAQLKDQRCPPDEIAEFNSTASIHIDDATVSNDDSPVRLPISVYGHVLFAPAGCDLELFRNASDGASAPSPDVAVVFGGQVSSANPQTAAPVAIHSLVLADSAPATDVQVRRFRVDWHHDGPRRGQLWRSESTEESCVFGSGAGALHSFGRI
jgi:hypothetical protein